VSSLRDLGSAFEDQAAAYLLEHGYTLVTRRYHARVGEIDLVAMDEDEIVFVEVKGRLSTDFVPEEAVGQDKIKRLRRAADKYLNEIDSMDRPHRFDLIAIDGSGLRHHVRAF